MDVLFCIAFVVMAASILPSHLTSSQQDVDEGVDGEEDICYGYHANKLYCTCQPSDIDVRGVNCFVLSEFPSSDPLWRSFASMTKLERLTFHSQGVGTLKYIPRQALKSSSGVLETLEIKHAALGSLPPYVFLNATALSTIDLSNNEITALERRSFAHLPVLRELALSENELTVIRRGTFIGPTKLSVLLLDRNRISQIEDSAFEDLSSLQELTLMKNELSRLNVAMFRGLLSLKRLDLGINRIGYLAPGVFSELTLVQEINLRENVLTAINPDAFVGLKHLLVLYLNRNRLAGIGDVTFSHLRALHYLDLRQNRLATLSEEAVASLNLRKSNTSQLYISDNEFACDCRIGWMLEMARAKTYDVLSQWKEIKCRLAESHSGIASTERVEEIRKKNDEDTDVALLNDGPEMSSTEDADRKLSFVFLEAASQYLDSDVGKVCLAGSTSSSPAKSDLTSDWPLVNDASSVSRSVRLDTCLFSIMMTISVVTINIASGH